MSVSRVKDSGLYTLFEMEVVEDEFSFICTCLDGRFVDILNLRN